MLYQINPNEIFGGRKKNHNFHCEEPNHRLMKNLKREAWKLLKIERNQKCW